MERAQRLSKASTRRDYFKILGLTRGANKKDVLKAYRKLAAEYHPDRFTSEAEKREAEKKFIDITAAKEVLTDQGTSKMANI
ncbi:unnamed protein product [Protopolystoma xenopodis]|uniref:J domain-containing protein n=1 Tax=Protopolystoma xenopodis TaxID=117903 RepID=A0A448WGN2_9PLAT|nr:unnamed protein product [Protopolystoma xenopodis]